MALAFDELQQLLFAVVFLYHLVIDIGAVKAGDEGFGILQAQIMADVGAGFLVGGGG